MLSAAATAVLSFISTNLDDIFILMILFAQESDRKTKRQIIMGQYLGIGILVTVSLLCAFGLRFVPQKYVGLLGIIPICIGIKTWFEHQQDSTASNGSQTEEPPIRLKHRSAVISTALLTIANGADNIGVYIPLFTGYSVPESIVTVIAFALLTGLWCLLGARLADLSAVKHFIQTYQHILVPIVLIGLGLYIIAEGFL